MGTANTPSNTLPNQGTGAPLPAYLKLQRLFFAVCIALAPLSVIIYSVSWARSPDPTSIATVGAGANLLHFVAGFLASFCLPLGYLGMALLGMRRSPWLATFSAGLALVGWIPWPALMGIDDLSFQIVQVGNTPQLTALWERFNADPLMSAYLYTYILGHLLSAVLLGIMLGRARLVPLWSAWALALSSPITILAFPTKSPILGILFLALLAIGVLPAAYTMLKFSPNNVGQPVSPM